MDHIPFQHKVLLYQKRCVSYRSARAVTVLAENEFTTPEIAPITEYAMKQVEAILEKYMARTRALN